MTFTFSAFAPEDEENSTTAIEFNTTNILLRGPTLAAW